MTSHHPTDTTPTGSPVTAAPPSPPAAGRPLAGRTVLTVGLALVLAVVAYRETRPVVFERTLDLYKVPTDFMVYFRAGEALACGEGIYDGPLYGHLPFTYPPFAGSIFRYVASAPAEMSATFWQLACVGALVAVVLGTLVQRGYRLDTGTIALGVAAAMAALALSPVRDSFFYGQINMLLMLLVALDFLRTRDRLTGIGVGIAAGLKLTPAFFILVFLMQRRWREAATATATFAVTVGIGVLTVPDAMRFWTSAIFDSSRIGSDTVSASQSLKGFTERTFDSDTTGTAVWLVSCVVVVALLYVAVRWATRRGNQALVMALAGRRAAGSAGGVGGDDPVRQPPGVGALVVHRPAVHVRAVEQHVGAVGRADPRGLRRGRSGRRGALASHRDGHRDGYRDRHRPRGGADRQQPRRTLRASCGVVDPRAAPARRRGGFAGYTASGPWTSTWSRDAIITRMATTATTAAT